MNPYEPSIEKEQQRLRRSAMIPAICGAIWCLPIVLPIAAALLTQFGLFSSLLGSSIFSAHFLVVVTFISPLVTILTSALIRLFLRDSLFTVSSIVHMVYCVFCAFSFRWLLLEMASSV